MEDSIAGIRSPWQPLHLDSYLEAEALGPIQRDEALLLFALVRTVRPEVIVEFGFGNGQSATNFLAALDGTGILYSYDTSNHSAEIAGERFAHFRNFRFLHKGQEHFLPSDIDGSAIDIVFIDGSHDFACNKMTFTRVLDSLAANAVVVVHDTGTWYREQFLPAHDSFSRHKPEGWLNESEYQHQRDERLFVNWVTEENYGFHSIHLHSIRCIRHGITLLQRHDNLPI